MNSLNHKYFLIKSIFLHIALAAFLLSNLIGAQLLDVAISSTHMSTSTDSDFSTRSNLDSISVGEFSEETNAELEASNFSSGIRASALDACSVTVLPSTLPDGLVGAIYNQQFTTNDLSLPYVFTITAGTLPPGLALTATGGLSGTPTSAGTYTFTVTATGGNGCTGSLAYTMTVRACPLITLSPATLPNGVVGIAYSQQIAASDPSPYTFTVTTGTLPPGLTLTPSGGLSGTPNTTGTYVFTVTATSGNLCTGSSAYTITISAGTCSVVNLLPAILPNGVVGIAYNQQITASDPSPYIFTITSGNLPTGLTLTPTGGLSGTPTTAGTYSFTVTATGGNGCTGSIAYTITVSTGTCSAISLQPSALPNATVVVPYNQQITVTDLSIPYVFTISSGILPPGLTLAQNGGLSGVPTTAGTYSFTVTATGGNGCTPSSPYTIIVSAANCGGLVLLPPTLSNGVLGTAYNQQISVNDPAPFSFTVTAGTVPAGLTLSPSGGLSGVPTTAGSYSFTVTATGGNGCSVGQPFSITISPSTNLHSQVNLSLPSGGAGTSFTVGGHGIVQAGYATGTMDGGTIPFGTAVFSLSSNGFVVSEAGVPASPPTTHAEIFIDFRTNVAAKSDQLNSGTININTGFAIVNRGGSLATITYTLRDSTGGSPPLATGTSTLAPSAHDARFIDQLQQIAPGFVVPQNFSTSTRFGSLEIQSDQPLSILALRLTGNQRGDTLLTSTPIADLTKPHSTGVLYFPQVVDGGGYQTTIILLNTSAAAETGSLKLFTDTGAPLIVKPVNVSSNSSFQYSIPPGGVFLLQTDGSPATVNAGSVQVIPDTGTTTPEGAGVFRFTQNGTVVTESGIPAATPTTHARIYVDESGGHDTGLAIAAPNGTPVNVTVSAFQTDGTTPAGTGVPVTLDGNGHAAKFVGQLVSGLPAGFTGVLDISSNSPFVALTLRSLSNGRDFLLTTFPIADYNQTVSSPIIFPQIADGGGFRTQFILLNLAGAGNATLSFFGDDGSPLAVGKSASR